MIVKFVDGGGRKHQWSFTGFTVLESVTIEDEFALSPDQFLELVGEYRGRALLLFLRLMYRREGIPVVDGEVDGNLTDLEMTLSQAERKRQEKAEAEEISPAIVATLKDYGVDATVIAVQRRLLEHVEGKDGIGPAADEPGPSKVSKPNAPRTRQRSGTNTASPT